jgi:hypothetical protein
MMEGDQPSFAAAAVVAGVLVDMALMEGALRIPEPKNVEEGVVGGGKIRADFLRGVQSLVAGGGGGGGVGVGGGGGFGFWVCFGCFCGWGAFVVGGVVQLLSLIKR